MAFSFLDCMRRFSQIILIVVNIIVSLLGLAVMIIGIWANVEGRNYIVITDNSSQFTEVSVLIIVLGLFVLLVGGVGVAGAIFASTMCGRITLGLYGVVLTLLVICEIAGGIAAAAKKGDLESVFNESATATFKLYYNTSDKTDAWDSFQKQFHCCGINNYTDYKAVFGNETLPKSCCKKTMDPDGEKCTVARNTSDPTLTDEIFNKGCVTVVVDGFSHNLGAIAGGAIVLGLIQIFGIVMACFVALYKKDETKYEVV